MEDIGRMAWAVVNNVPFYRWLYKERYSLSDEEIRSGHVPLFSKEDVWQYEDVCQRPYYLSPRIPALDSLVFIHTSGTAGRKAFPVPVVNAEGRGFEHVHDTLEETFTNIIRDKPRVWIQKELPPGFAAIIDQCAKYRGIIYELISCRAPLEEQMSQAKAARCNALVDLTGAISAEIARERFPLEDSGLRVVATTYLPVHVSEYLKSQGVTVIFYFGAADSLVVHPGCQYTPINVFHVKSRGSIHEVLEPDGSISRYGYGQYVTSDLRPPFPLVRYTNTDVVQLRPSSCPCGFEGTDLVFQNRPSFVKLGSGPSVNFDQVYRHYSSDPRNSKVVIVFGLCMNDGNHHIYVLIEREDISEPVVDQDGWQIVMHHGVGGIDSYYRDRIKVVILPERTIPAGVDSHKGQILFDLTKACINHSVKEIARLILETVGERVDIHGCD